jgi:hypothetical protein
LVCCHCQSTAGGGLFGPDALMRLAMDSRTRHLMEDKEFQGMLQGLMTNPGMIGAHLNDPRMQLVRGGGGLRFGVEV